MASPVVEPAAPLLCEGIHHNRVLQYEKDNPNDLSYLDGILHRIRGNWHSKDCLFVAISEKKKRCTKCDTFLKNIRESRYPKLWPKESPAEEPSPEPPPPASPPSPPPAEDESAPADSTAPIESLVFSDRAALRRRIEELNDSVGEDGDLSKNAELALAAKVLKTIGEHTIELGGNLIFVACDGDGCEAIFIKKARANVCRTCKRCVRGRYEQVRCAMRKEIHKEDRVKANSDCPISALDDEERKERIANLNLERKLEKLELERVLEKCSVLGKKYKVSEKMRKHMDKAMSDLADKESVQKSLADRIFDILKELEAEGNYTKKVPITREMARQFVDSMAIQAKNWVHVARGRNTACRWNGPSMGGAMSEYLRGPAAFEQSKEDNIFIRPSVSQLKKIKQKQKIKDGFDAGLLLPQPTYRGTGKEEWGQIGMDEMKLQKGVQLNAKTDELTGLTNDFFDLKKIIKNLLDDKEIEDEQEPASYVTQYSYRTVGGRVYNIMFFFNNGSTSADVVMQQVFHCIMCCELVGSRVFGLVCDAGGSFQRLFRYLRKKERLPEEAWLPIESVTFQNPFDPSRLIALFHCATHGLKNQRNGLWQSKTNGAKRYLDVDGLFITSELWAEAWLRDEERASGNNQLRMTDLRQGAIELDKWSCMNARFSKAPFSWKTLIEMLYSLYLELGVVRSDLFRVDQNSSGTLGYLSAAAEHLKALWKAKDPTNTKLGSKISSFEFGCHLSELYNLRAMKLDEMVRHDNIDRLEAQTKKNLEYFGRLRKAQLERKLAGVSDWEVTFIPLDTYNIMRISFRGYFVYCRALIDAAKNTPPDRLPAGIRSDLAISPSHFLTSWIEAWFALARIMGFDEATKYAAGVANRLMAQGIKQSLKKNSMYEAEDVGDVIEDIKKMGQKELANLHQAKRKLVQELIAAYNSKKTSYSSPSPAFTILDIDGSDITMAGEVCEAGSLATSTGPSSARSAATDSGLEDASMHTSAASPRDASMHTEDSPMHTLPATLINVSETASMHTSAATSSETASMHTSAKRASECSTPNCAVSLATSDDSQSSPCLAAVAKDLFGGGDCSNTAAPKTAATLVTSIGKRAAGTAQKSPPKPSGVSPALKKSKPAVINPYKKSSAPAAKPAVLNPSAAADKSDGDEEDLPPPPPPSPEEMLRRAINQIKKKSLRDGFASFLLEQQSFEQWMLVSKEDANVWKWFESILNDTLDPTTSKAFDQACRLIMDELVLFAKAAMENRSSTSSDSFEYKLFHFMYSPDLESICMTKLPTEAMRSVRAGWVILTEELAAILRKWLRQTVRSERQKKDPELFHRTTIVNMSDEALTSEVHRVFGWAIRNCRDGKRFDSKSAEHRLLDSMVCLEKDADEEFIAKRVDLLTLLRNIGGEGGLCLVQDAFLEWGKKAMLAVAKQLTVDDIRMKGDPSLKAAKKFILGHATLKSDLALICMREQSRSANLRREGEPEINYAVVSVVYDAFMTKVCNARYGETLKNYCEQEALKGRGKLNFRSNLLAASKRSNESNADSGHDGSTSGAPSAPSFVVPKPGVNTAVSKTFLSGKAFIISGEFEEIDCDWRVAHECITKMIESFGGTVMKRYSKKTSKYFRMLLCSTTIPR